MARLVDAHIEAQARLRRLTALAVERAWRGLGSWDEADVPRFLGRVVPVVLMAQRQSARQTDAYLARALQRRPMGVAADRLIGSAVRNGTPPETVYRRPFVTLWGGLSEGHPFADAFGAGMARAVGAARMDVQLSMTNTAASVGSQDPRIQRFQRVADADACEFCSAVDGAILSSEDPMPLHNGCGCGVEPLTDDPALTKPPSGVAVDQHGELGPVLGDSAHAFTGPSGLT